MTKENVKDMIKRGMLYNYGFITPKQLEAIKEKNIHFKKDLQPIKKTFSSNIGSSWKDIDVLEYDGFILLNFKGFNNIGVYNTIQKG